MAGGSIGRHHGRYKAESGEVERLAGRRVWVTPRRRARRPPLSDFSPRTASKMLQRDGPSAARRIAAAERRDRAFVIARDVMTGGDHEMRTIPRLEWHRAAAPGVEVGEITTHGLALSRLKHGFESRREGPKGVRSSLRRQSFSSESKREVIAPALGRTRRGFAPATRQLREAESRMRGAGEGEGIAHRLIKDRRPFFR